MKPGSLQPTERAGSPAQVQLDTSGNKLKLTLFPSKRFSVSCSFLPWISGKQLGGLLNTVEWTQTKLGQQATKMSISCLQQISKEYNFVFFSQ